MAEAWMDLERIEALLGELEPWPPLVVVVDRWVDVVDVPPGERREA